MGRIIATLKDDIGSLGEKASLSDLISLLEKDISNLRHYPSHRHALIVLTTIENLQTQVVCLENVSGYVSSNQSSTSQLKPSGFWQKIKNYIKALSSSIWQLISRLLNLKEWSVSGAVSGSVLGIASGTMKLQLIFA